MFGVQECVNEYELIYQIPLNSPNNLLVTLCVMFVGWLI